MTRRGVLVKSLSGIVRVWAGGNRVLDGETVEIGGLTFGFVGGGLPVGAYGGRAALMELVSPAGPVYQAGTLSGNPLAVVIESEGLSDRAMQLIAREFALSETVFLLPPTKPNTRAALRIFTPARELPFAGHPTVGTSVLIALLANQGAKGETFILEEQVGLVPVAAHLGVGGALGAIAVQFVSPDSFTLFLSISLLVGIVVGGVGTLWGALYGAVFIMFVPDMAEKVSKAAPWAVYGAVLIVFMFVMPGGVVGLLRRIETAWRSRA